MIVTSFSQKGYHEYGKRFIETFLEHWRDEKLVVYFERGVPSTKPEDPRVEYINLYSFEDFVAFEQIIGASHPIFSGWMRHPQKDKPIYNFRFDVNRFYRKVYAITDAYINRKGNEQRIAWVDADVSFHKDVPTDFLSQLLPEDKAFAHLNREWLYTEAGFMVFNVGHPLMELFMLLYKSTYFNGAFRYLGEMHDCYVIDLVSRQLDIPRVSLTVNEKSDHPFQESVLGEYMVHLKGPVRKQQGQLLDTDPIRKIA